MIFQLIHNATYKVTFANTTFLVDPAVPVDEFMGDVDYILLTQIHPDHFNASCISDKSLPVIVKSEQESQYLQSQGFRNVRVLKDKMRIDVIITLGNAPARGYLLDNASERPVYLAGDTKWTPEIKKQLTDHLSELMVVSATEDAAASACECMSRTDLIEAAAAAKHGVIFAIHLPQEKDQLSLRAFTEKIEMTEKIIVPADREIHMM